MELVRVWAEFMMIRMGISQVGSFECGNVFGFQKAPGISLQAE
jgi:hypothetical protein